MAYTKLKSMVTGSVFRHAHNQVQKFRFCNKTNTGKSWGDRIGGCQEIGAPLCVGGYTKMKKIRSQNSEIMQII